MIDVSKCCQLFMCNRYFDGLVQNCGISSALGMEILYVVLHSAMD